MAGAKLTLLRKGPVELYRAQFLHSTVIAAIPVSPVSDATRELLRYEYGIRNKLVDGFALRPLRFAVHNQNPALLLQDPGGDMLSGLVASAMEPEDFFRHALGISNSLASAHEAGLVHGGLMPSNIMIHPPERQARLTGFRSHGHILALAAADGSQHEIDREFLHYVAPEATGRVNRVPDERSDLYSLGCILYRMLTGNVLFPGLAPWELVHAHVARRPDEDVLSNIRQRFGAPIVDLVCRLLAKDPDERYRTALDVVDDLVTLGTLKPSQSGTSEQRRLPQAPFQWEGLIGREPEIDRLRSAILDRKDEKQRCLWLVEGPAGIGKTALINHFRKTSGGEHFEFAHGKCELEDGITPYASFSRALKTLSASALSYPPTEYDQLQRRLREELAGDASIITKIFPGLVRLLGEHTHKPAVSPQAERFRFLDAIARLLGSFGSIERPLLLFFDDLQWIDEATLEVVSHVLQSHLCRHVVLLAAMRDRQIENQGPHVQPFLSANVIERVPLGPLSGSDVGNLLRTVLADDVNDSDALASSLLRSAGGNPLHTIQFVRSLVADDVMVYDQGSGKWTASLTDVDARSNDSSVVDLLSARVATLPDESLVAIQYLAILAEPSPLEVLSAAMNVSGRVVELALQEAADEQLIALRDGLYGFAHDRIRDSIYLTLSDAQRDEKHVEVGSNLWGHVRNGLNISAFVVAKHLTRALLPVTDPRRRQFAAIILEAALKAKEATAYESAIAYLTSARRFLEDRADTDGDLFSIIELRLGECEFACMRVTTASERTAAISTHLLDPAHRAELIRLRLALHVALGQTDIALDIGYRYLAEETGIELSRLIQPGELEREYRRFLELYGNRSVEEILQLPFVIDDRVRHAMDVMTDLIPAVQFTSQDLVEVLILRMINLSLEYGLCDASCYAYICLSFVAGAKFEDYTTTAVFGEVAMRLPNERGLRLYEGRVQMCYGSLCLPWTGAAEEAKRHLEEAVELTGRQGDLTFAVYSRRHIVTNVLFSGGSLSEAQQVAEDGLKLARDAGFALVIDAFMAQAWLIRKLRGVPLDIGLADCSADYAELLADCISGNYQRDIAAFAFWTYRMQAAYLWGDLADAALAEGHAIKTAWASPAFLENADFVFYSGLLNIALARTSSTADRESHVQQAMNRIHTMRCWAKSCPGNFLSRERLMAAELSALADDDRNALPLYEEAIALADRSHDMHLQSVARELASRSAGRCGLCSAQQGYLEQARSAYATWGADAKAKQLESEFPSLLSGRRTEFQEIGSSLAWSEDRFEAEVVLRSVRALSGEISLPEVIKVILQSTLQYAGADRAALCLLEDSSLHIAAQASLIRGQFEIDLVRQPLSSDLLATPIVYLTLRSKESVVVEDAREDPQYGHDGYVRIHKSRSILCIPLVKQGVLTGLLYLENALIAGVFDGTRVRTLEVLASQATVSLENAKLYESVEAEHKRRAEAEHRVRETQAKLAQAARLTELGELAAFIVHELGQPITALGTYARTAIRWLNRDIPQIEKAVEALEKISASTERARSIIQSIRSMVKESRPNIGRMDIREAILEVFSVLQERIDAENVLISTAFEPGSEIVLGDRILLQQVIVNLVTNALEAMSETQEHEKHIEVQTRMGDGDKIWISVADTGRGISEDIYGHIFDSLATTKGYGMGMGLSICRSVVEAHDGQIEVSSSDSSGTCFRFSIPRAAS